VGLGLSTTYGIIERHNGKIHASSIKGQGTMFTIELPVGPNEKKT
jgi:signal transduction histidine kinase